MKKHLLLLLILTSSFFSKAQTALKLVDKGLEFIDNKKFDSALIVLNKAWSIDSTIYQIYIGRGAAYSELEKWDESYLEFTKAIDKFPDSAYGYHFRAMLFSKLTSNDAAIADNTKALQLTDEDTFRVVLYMNRGVAYMQKRDFQKAYEDYSRAYLLDTNSTAILNNIATVLDELGRVDEAIASLKKITVIDPTFVGPYVNLGFQFTKLGKYKEAIEYFDKALTLEKDEPLALNNRGLAKYHIKDYQGALEDINKSISIYPGNSYAYKNRALVYIELNEKEKACADIKAALDRGFTEMYGPEVLEMKKVNCPKN